MVLMAEKLVRQGARRIQARTAAACVDDIGEEARVKRCAEFRARTEGGNNIYP